jgi:hypothetical protein
LRIKSREKRARRRRASWPKGRRGATSLGRSLDHRQHPRSPLPSAPSQAGQSFFRPVFAFHRNRPDDDGDANRLSRALRRLTSPGRDFRGSRTPIKRHRETEYRPPSRRRPAGGQRQGKGQGRGARWLIGRIFPIVFHRAIG